MAKLFRVYQKHIINNIIPYVSVITVPISLFLRFCLFVFSMIYMIRCYASENNIKKWRERNRTYNKIIFYYFRVSYRSVKLSSNAAAGYSNSKFLRTKGEISPKYAIFLPLTTARAALPEINESCSTATVL